MSEEIYLETARPVVVSYPLGAAPSDLHPNGMPAGFVCESPTPELAKQFHPDALILRYVDGGEYSDRKAAAELRKRDKALEPTESPETSAKPAKASKAKAAKTPAPKRARVKVVTPADEPTPEAVAETIVANQAPPETES